MNKTLSLLLATFLTSIASMVSAQSYNLCQLPQGMMTKKWIIVDDKSTQTTERYGYVPFKG